MAELSYSREARNVLNQFYGVDRIVYVEGDDDITFWEFLFEKFSTIKVKVEESGGKEELESRINDVINGDTNFFVAMDSDFDRLSVDLENPNVLRTFGYSMENTIVSGLGLHRVICNVAKLQKQKFPIDACEEWLESLNKAIQSVVTYDWVNRQEDAGEVVLTDNCDRFLKSKNSYQLCPDKLSLHLQNLNVEVFPEHEELVEQHLDTHNMRWVDLLRGHFLMSAAFKFVQMKISRLRSKVSISREMFYGSLMLAFESSFNNTHRHYNYYKRIISSLSE